MRSSVELTWRISPRESKCWSGLRTPIPYLSVAKGSPTVEEYGSCAIIPESKVSSTTTALVCPNCSDIKQSPQDFVMSKLELGAKSGILSSAVEPSTAHNVRPEVCSTEVIPELVSTNMRVS